MSFLVFLLFVAIINYGQTSSNNGGGEVQGATFNLQWSLGQVATKTISSEDFKLTQGELQPNINPAIPTLSQWGYFILLLLFLNIGMVVLKYNFINYQSYYSSTCNNLIS
jgi:hypothetical protein